MLAPLEEQFQYHSWATLHLLDHCGGLTAKALDYTAPGTMGTIHDTFVHLARAEAWYLLLMTGQAPVHVDNTIRYQLADLRAYFVALNDAWQYVLAHLDDYDPTLPKDDRSVEVPHARNLLLAQALHHGNDHRTHICSILGANGLEVPEADVWMYWWVTYLKPDD